MNSTNAVDAIAATITAGASVAPASACSTISAAPSVPVASDTCAE
jgi:hypothetical protein